MLEIIICDDEKVFRNDLKRIIGTELDLCGMIYHLTEFSCGEDLIAGFKEHQEKQIIFLDIEMKRLNGMDTAKEIRRRSPFAIIIFVTSYSDFVFEGYGVRAFHYILKPYEKVKILSILHEALEAFDLSQDTSFIIEQRGGTIRLPFQSIKYFYSERHSIFAVTETETYSFYGKLNDLISQLPDCFSRIHNRYLINLKYLHKIEDNTALLDNEYLPVSRSYRHELSIAYAKYILQ